MSFIWAAELNDGVPYLSSSSPAIIAVQRGVPNEWLAAVGVVISVLWLLTFSIYILVDSDRSAPAINQIWFAADKPDELKAVDQTCAQSSNQAFITPEKLMWSLLRLEKRVIAAPGNHFNTRCSFLDGRGRRLRHDSLDMARL